MHLSHYCMVLYILSSEAEVRLEKTVYQVKEGEGEVELCAIISSPKVLCPVAIPFKVILSISDKSEGSYTI